MLAAGYRFWCPAKARVLFLIEPVHLDWPLQPIAPNSLSVKPNQPPVSELPRPLRYSAGWWRVLDVQRAFEHL